MLKLQDGDCRGGRTNQSARTVLIFQRERINGHPDMVLDICCHLHFGTDRTSYQPQPEPDSERQIASQVLTGQIERG
jgi:hypothetical protein